MKQNDRHLFAAPLYVVLALLLCFCSCQSSDNAVAGEGAPVASLPLAAQIGETSSRVGMTDIYGGAFNCYWNSDQLSISQKYVLNGGVQSMNSPRIDKVEVIRAGKVRRAKLYYIRGKVGKKSKVKELLVAKNDAAPEKVKA